MSQGNQIKDLEKGKRDLKKEVDYLRSFLRKFKTSEEEGTLYRNQIDNYEKQILEIENQIKELK